MSVNEIIPGRSSELLTKSLCCVYDAHDDCTGEVCVCRCHTHSYRYLAPSGVRVTSCKPFPGDAWATGHLAYGLHAYRDILRTVVWKNPRRARRIRRERRMDLEHELIGRLEFDEWRRSLPGWVPPYDWADFGRAEKEKWIERALARQAKEKPE